MMLSYSTFITELKAEIILILLMIILNTLTPSSSLMSSSHSGHCGVVLLAISSSAQSLHTLCPQPSWTGSRRSESHLTQEYRSRLSESLKTCLGISSIFATITNDSIAADPLIFSQ